MRECSLERPCPYVSCKYHMLWLHVYDDNPKNRCRNVTHMSDDEIIELIENMPDTCEIDIVKRHPEGVTLQELATQMGGITRERVRQIQERAIRKLKMKVTLWKYRKYKEYEGYDSLLNVDPYTEYLPDMEGVEQDTRGKAGNHRWETYYDECKKPKRANAQIR